MRFNIYQPLATAIVVTGVGQAIIEKLQATPESGGVPTGMRQCLIVPGAIAADGCKCGQLALTIMSWAPSEINPANSSDSPRRAACGPPSQVTQVIAALFRCVPTMDDQGRPPTCQALRTSALSLVADQWAMREGATEYLCGLKTDYTVADFRVGTAVPIGPEGACGGIELGFSFQLV